MKKMRLDIVSVLAVLSIGAVVRGSEKIPISVTAFQDRAARSGGEGCGGKWWYQVDELGSAFKDILVERLQESERFQILEREHINTIYGNEYNLVNSQKSEANPRGHFKVARYTFAGVVTEFDWCPQSGGGVGLDLSGLIHVPFSVSPYLSKAHVKVSIRLIDVRTGEIILNASGVGDRNYAGLGVGLVTGVISFKGKGFENSPLSEAVEEAINEAADKVIAKIPLS